MAHDSLIDRNYIIAAFILAKSPHSDVRIKVAEFISGE